MTNQVRLDDQWFNDFARKLLIPTAVLSVLAVLVGLVAALAGVPHRNAERTGLVVFAVGALLLAIRAVMFGRSERRRLLGGSDGGSTR